MPGLHTDVDPDGLLEYSVVFTDRSLNHMSQKFQDVMRETASILKKVYNARSAIFVPGGGTYAMEAVARQFATGKSCLVIRNGWFSFRWTQIFEAGAIPSDEIVMKARRVGNAMDAPFAPAPIEDNAYGQDLTAIRSDWYGAIANYRRSGLLADYLGPQMHKLFGIVKQAEFDQFMDERAKAAKESRETEDA